MCIDYLFCGCFTTQPNDKKAVPDKFGRKPRLVDPMIQRSPVRSPIRQPSNSNIAASRPQIPLIENRSPPIVSINTKYKDTDVIVIFK